MNTFDPTVETPSRLSRGLPDSPELEREIAEYLPSYEPTDAELEQEYQQHLSRSRTAAEAAGIEPGFTYRTGSGTPYEGFADLPDGERVYTGLRVASAMDADDAAILLAGRLSLEKHIPAGYEDRPCRFCSAAIMVPVGADPVCQRCQETAGRLVGPIGPWRREFLERIVAALSDETVAYIVADPARSLHAYAGLDVIREVYQVELARRVARRSVEIVGAA